MKENKIILLVDDDADDRKLFLDAVKEVDENISCITAANGQQALELLNDEEKPLPDFIFLDLSMPRLNGAECLAEMKKTERLKHIPVIIYTTSSEVEEAKTLKDMGAYHFMTKPGNAEEIYYMVSVVLEDQWNTTQNNKNNIKGLTSNPNS